MTISTTIRDRIAVLRNEARVRNQERAEHRALQQELASYRTAREVDDLLGVLAHQDSDDAQRIRDILTDTVRSTVGVGRI